MRHCAYQKRWFFAPCALLLLVFVLLLYAAPIHAAPAAQITPTPIPVATPLPGVPVTLHGKTLFYVYQGIGTLTPAERAALISSRLEQVATDPFAPPLTITLADSDAGTNLIANDKVLLTVTEADAAAASEPRNIAAEKAARYIEKVVADYRTQNTPLERAARLALAIAIVVAILVLLYFFNRWLTRRIDRLEKLPDDEQTQPLISISGPRTGFWRQIVQRLFSVGRILIILLLAILITPFILRLFPQTTAFADQLAIWFNSILSTLWIWFTEQRSNLLDILIILVVTYLLTRLITALFREVANGTLRIRGFEPDWAAFTGQIVKFLFWLAAVMMIYPNIPGSQTESFRGITILLGALFTLSSTAAVSNVVAGVIQTYTGAFRAGDVVKIGETFGTVIQKRLLTTRVRTFKQEEVSIPNSQVMGATVMNYSTMARTKGLVIYTTVQIAYTVPWRTVHQLLLAAAAKTPGMLQDPPPYILQTSLNPHNVSYQLNCYINQPQILPRLYSDLHQTVQEVFAQADIEIMSPTYTALRDGSAPAVPPAVPPAVVE